MSVILPVNLGLSDFEPKRREIDDITNARRAVVTTTEPHQYVDGQTVRVSTSKQNPMRIDGLQTEIKLLSTTEFEIELDTREFEPFDEPVYSQNFDAFTPSQVIPIEGVFKNTAGPLT